MVPFELDHPVWVRDPDFAIDNHVRTTEVPAPGGRLELEAAIAKLHEQPLDRSRPLWDLWVLTGLEGGRIAYYNRSHHACLDGMAGQVMLQTIMDTSPSPREVAPAPAEFFTSCPQPTPTQLLVGAFENFARYTAKAPLAWFNAIETSARLFQRAYDPNKGFGAAFEGAPRTRFNQPVTRRRSYATGEMSLAAAKGVATATDSKINDVFLAACAGGLRRYFERSQVLPDKSLIAGCPVSLRQPGDESTNNQVTMMLVSLATDEADPAERLQKIAQSSRTAKGFTADIAASYDTDVAMPGLPGLLRSNALLAENSPSNELPGQQTPCSLVISNVPGPKQTLYSCGAKVLTHYPVSIPTHMQGVNITVQSYAGQLYFSVTACAKALPDPQQLRDDILEGFVELRTVTTEAAPVISVAPQQPSSVNPKSEEGSASNLVEQERPKAA